MLFHLNPMYLINIRLCLYFRNKEPEIQEGEVTCQVHTTRKYPLQCISQSPVRVKKASQHVRVERGLKVGIQSSHCTLQETEAKKS